jgi:hypothetical protein
MGALPPSLAEGWDRSVPRVRHADALAGEAIAGCAPAMATQDGIFVFANALGQTRLWSQAAPAGRRGWGGS